MKYIFTYTVIIFLFAANAFSQVRADLYDTAPTQGLHKIQKKLDTTQGIHRESPSQQDLDKFRGFDVSSPCTFFRSTWVHPDMCAKLVAGTLSAASPKSAKSQMKTYSGVSSRDSCVDLFSNFDSEKIKNVSKAQKDGMIYCKAFCKTTPNFKNSRDFCGVETCVAKSKFGEEVGKWCCDMAGFWGNKLGTKENPLQDMLDSGKCVGYESMDYFYCTEYYEENRSVPEHCCHKLGDISRFDTALGLEMAKQCSLSTASRNCYWQFENEGKIDDSCCTLSKAYDGDISKSPIFFASASVTKKINNNLGKTCEAYDPARNQEYTGCVESVKAGRGLIAECCIAYSKGILSPEAENIDYIEIEKFCYPEKFSDSSKNMKEILKTIKKGDGSVLKSLMKKPLKVRVYNADKDFKLPVINNMKFDLKIDSGVKNDPIKKPGM